MSPDGESPKQYSHGGQGQPGTITHGIAKAQYHLRSRTAAAEGMTEVNNEKAAAVEAVAAPQQTEECSGATAAMRKYTNAAATQGSGSGARHCGRGTDAIATSKHCTASGQFCHANQRSGKQRSAENP